MMKKLSKIALLAAASAFMLAVFPACGDDEEEADPKATLTLVSDPVELGTGPETVEATVTLENDTFSAEAKESIPANVLILKDNFELKATDTKVTVSEATLVEWTSDTVAKISFTVTAAAGAADGTISAEIKEGTLTSNKTLTTAGNIAYTIKKVEQDPVPTVEIVSEATSMTVEVEGTLDLMAEVSNFPEGVTYEWESDNEDVATVVQNPNNETQAQVTAIAAGTAKITVTAKSGDTEKSADVEVTVKAKGSVGDEGKGGVVWTWTVADYVKSSSSTKFGDETKCGNITAGKNVKETTTGVGVNGTLSEGVGGYFQVSAGADGSVWFTAPAGTKKIIVCAKLDSTSKQIVLRTNATSTTDYTDLGKKTGEANTNYRDLSFDVEIAEDTVVYVGTFATGVSANLKAIQISK